MSRVTRKFLTALGIEAEKVDQIVEAHSADMTEIKEERDTALEAAKGVPDITKQRDDLQKQLDEVKSKAPDAAKAQAEFDAFKAQVEGEKTTAKKQTLFQEALKAAGVARESAQKALLKAVDLSAVKLTEDGKLDGVEALVTPLKTEYADFFSTSQQGGVPPTNPPTGGAKSTDKEQFSKMNVSQRAALAASDAQAYAALKGD